MKAFPPSWRPQWAAKPALFAQFEKQIDLAITSSAPHQLHLPLHVMSGDDAGA